MIIQTVKKSKWSIIGYILASALLLWMYVGIYPSISQHGEELSKYIESFPKELFKAFGMDVQSFFTKLEGYLGGEHYSLIWPLLLIMLAISFGSAALAGEIERGTIGILLSQPLSRLKLFLGKYLAGLTVLLTFVWASILSIIPLALLYNVDYLPSNHIKIAILGSLFALTLLSITMMFSSFFSERGRATMFTTMVLLAMYVLKVLANLKESLENLKYLSLFHYFDYNEALVNNKIDLQSVGVFLGVSLVCTLVGLYWFNRRDIAAS